MSNIRQTEFDEKDIWKEQETSGKRPWYLYVLILITLLILGFIVGAFGTISFPLEYGVNYFWTGIVIQQVGSVWFGAWGVIAGMIFPIFSNAVTATPFIVSLAYIPANFIQSFLPAYVFRKYKLDPDLRSALDYVYLFLAMLVSNLLGALWSVLVVLNGFDLLREGSSLNYLWGWFGGNLVAGIIFNFVFLKIMVRNESLVKLFMKKWWS